MRFKGYSDAALCTLLKDRFTVSYRSLADELEAFIMAKNICVEQTVESPSGGMTFDKIAQMKTFEDIFGNEAVYLMGGGLYTYSPDLTKNCRMFMERQQEKE